LLPDSGVKVGEKKMEKWLGKYLAVRDHKLFQGMDTEMDMGDC